MDEMIPTINFRYLLEHDAESSEDEELLPVPSTSSHDSNPPVHSISADELAAPSTSMVLPVIMVDIPSPVPSARAIDLDAIKPEKLEYVTYESRLNSFATWPTYMTQTSEELAHAGFYYTGINDFTTCYHCGIIIRNWRSEEDPWDRHMISSPNCCHFLTVRGWEYVNNVTGQELYETSEGAPIEITYENAERSNSENDTNEMTLAEKIAAMEQENRALKDARSCKVCTEREATITFLPCGHLATCQYCSPAFTTCIICRREVKAIARAFFA